MLQDKRHNFIVPYKLKRNLQTLNKEKKKLFCCRSSLSTLVHFLTFLLNITLSFLEIANVDPISQVWVRGGGENVDGFTRQIGVCLPQCLTPWLGIGEGKGPSCEMDLGERVVLQGTSGPLTHHGADTFLSISAANRGK